MKKIFNWLITSSADPQKVSLTVKALGAGAATYVLFASHFFGLAALTPDSWNDVVGQASQLAESVLMAVSLLAAIYGGARKLYITAKGLLQKPPVQ